MSEEKKPISTFRELGEKLLIGVVLVAAAGAFVFVMGWYMAAHGPR
jgi:hypothetical protein